MNSVLAAQNDPLHADGLPPAGVSVVVPMLNESECVGGLLESLADLESLLGPAYRVEFLLVDDGSTDGTPERIEEITADAPNYRVIRHDQNRGVAAAIFTGIKHSQTPLVASIDADGSYDIGLLAEMLPMTGPETPLVTASPYHPHGDAVGVPEWRLGLSRLASRMYALFMPQRLTCYTACFRSYYREAVLGCEPTNDGFTGVTELLWRVQRSGAAVAEVPAILRPRVAGVSKMRVVRTMLAHARLLSRIALRSTADTVLGRRPPVASSQPHLTPR